MKVRHERLRWARKRAHFTSAAAAAARLGIPEGTYAGHENGSRAFGPDEAELYAKRFGVTAGWLMFGEGDPQGKDRPLTALENEILSVYRRIPEEHHQRAVAALELGAMPDSSADQEPSPAPRSATGKPAA